MPLLKRIAIFGPPAGGKSSLISELKKMFGEEAKHGNLDDHILRLCKERNISGQLDDEIIDEAVKQLIEDSQNWNNGFIEIPHHDYIKLILKKIIRLEDFDLVLVITNTLPNLFKRNSQRRYIIPEPYITRCFGAAAGIAEHLKGQAIPWMILDSSLMDANEMAVFISDYLRQNSSKSLSNLNIVPVPHAPYLGGHYRDDAEWDENLVKRVVKQFGVKTALDVGCGTGVTLDFFGKHGVVCWGIEGNFRVLDGPCLSKERLLIVDFHKQWVKFPTDFDLIWCVEVLEHIPPQYEENVVQTIVRNARKIVFISAAQPGQVGYFHVNCKPRSYWIDRFQKAGLKWMKEEDAFLSELKDGGFFGKNFIKENGVFFQVAK